MAEGDAEFKKSSSDVKRSEFICDFFTAQFSGIYGSLATIVRAEIAMDASSELMAAAYIAPEVAISYER
jgi:hypothetical protein